MVKKWLCSFWLFEDFEKNVFRSSVRNHWSTQQLNFSGLKFFLHVLRVQIDGERELLLLSAIVKFSKRGKISPGAEVGFFELIQIQVQPNDQGSKKSELYK